MGDDGYGTKTFSKWSEGVVPRVCCMPRLSVTSQCTGLVTRGLVDACGVVVRNKGVCVFTLGLFYSGAWCYFASGDIKVTNRWRVVLDQA